MPNHSRTIPKKKKKKKKKKKEGATQRCNIVPTFLLTTPARWAYVQVGSMAGQELFWGFLPLAEWHIQVRHLIQL